METTDGVKKSGETLVRVNDLKDRLNVLKTSFTENEINVQRAATEADRAEELANQVEQVRTRFCDLNRIWVGKSSFCSPMFILLDLPLHLSSCKDSFCFGLDPH